MPLSVFLIVKFNNLKVSAFEEHVTFRHRHGANTMVQLFIILMVLCLAERSIGTTSKPQEQNVSAPKDLCQVSTRCVVWTPIVLCFKTHFMLVVLIGPNKF